MVRNLVAFGWLRSDFTFFNQTTLLQLQVVVIFGIPKARMKVKG